MRTLNLGAKILALLSPFYVATAFAADSAPAPAHAPYGQVRIVVPITSGDSNVWAFRLHNLQNGFNAAREGQGKVEATVVLYGPGVKLLSDPVDSELKHLVDDLRTAGVHFDLCNNTLQAMHMNWNQFYGAASSDVVPSGFLEVAWLANHGWAVDPMN